jgi:hypothetical protein
MIALRTLCLLLAPASLLAGCSQAPTAAQADAQDRLIAAEARATAAEKRARNAEIAAELHAQEPVRHAPPADEGEVGEPANDFGQPVNDTKPIEPSPVVNPDAPQQ